MKKILILITFVLLISTLQFFQPLFSVYAEKATEHSVWKNWDSKENVPVNKSWTISFNQPVDSDSINKDNVYIVDSKNNMVDISFALSNEGRELIIEAPTTGYNPFETYTLYITENVKSNSQQILNEPIKMEFIVGSDEIVKFKPLVPREDSKNEVVYQDNVKLLNEQQSQSINVLDENTIIANDVSSLLEIGDVLVLPPSEEYPFGLAKKIISIDKTSEQQIFKTEEPSIDEIIQNIDISQRIPITLDHVKGDISLEPNRNILLASTDSKVLNNGVIASVSGEDIELSFSNLQIGENYYVDGAITLKNSELFVDINDDWFWKGIKSGVVEFDGTVDIHAAIGAKQQIKEGFRKEVKIIDFYVPVPSFPIVGASFELFLVTELNGEVRLEYRKSMDFQIGAQWNEGSVNKIDNAKLPEEYYSPKEETSLTGEVNFNGKIGMGAGVYLSITEIKLVGMAVDAGLKTKLATYLYKDTACYKGSNSIYLDAGIDIKVLKSKYTLLGVEKLLDNTDVCQYVEELNVSPLEIKLNPGESQLIRIEKLYKAGRPDYTLKDITFTSSDESIAMVDNQGTVTVNKNAKQGSTTEIDVTYNNQSGNEIKKKVQVTILPSTEEPNEDNDNDNEPGEGSDNPNINYSYQLASLGGSYWDYPRWSPPGSFILKKDGTVWAFGSNNTGELGLGFESEEVKQPQQLKNLPKIKKVIFGIYNTLFLTTDGKVYAREKKLWSNVIDGSVVVPFLLEELVDIVDIAVTNDAEYYLKSDGTVWRSGKYPAVRNGEGYTLPPFQIEGLTGIVKIFNNGAVLKADGTIWGMYYVGESEFWRQYTELSEIVWADEDYFVKADGSLWESYSLRDKPVITYKYEGISNVMKISGNTILLKDGTVKMIVTGDVQDGRQMPPERYVNINRVNKVDYFAGYENIGFYYADVPGLIDIVDISNNVAVDKYGGVWEIRNNWKEQKIDINLIPKNL